MPYKNPLDKKIRQRNRISKRRKDWFDANGPCKNCGSTEKLEADHIDPSTKISDKFWSWSEQRMNEELEKCQVLCKNCHEDKTLKEQGREESKHGTIGRYKNKKYNCRCNLCKRANTIYRRKQRAKKLTLDTPGAQC